MSTFLYSSFNVLIIFYCITISSKKNCIKKSKINDFCWFCRIFLEFFLSGKVTKYSSIKDVSKYAYCCLTKAFFRIMLTLKPSFPLLYSHHLSTDQPLMPSDPLKGCVRKGCRESVTRPTSLLFGYIVRPGSHNDNVLLFSSCRLNRIILCRLNF